MENYLTRHWREYINSDYMGAYSFLEEGGGNNEVKATPKALIITNVKQEEIKGEMGRIDVRLVCYFKGEKKGMIINVTNADKIAELYGEGCLIPKNWIGKTIVVNAIKVLENKQWIWRMRIIGKPKPSKPNFTPSHQKWKGAIKAIKDGNFTIDQLKKSFHISEENLSLLKKEINDK